MKSSLLVCYIFVIIELKSLNISLQILHHYFYIFLKETFFGENLYSVGYRDIATTGNVSDTLYSFRDEKFREPISRYRYFKSFPFTYHSVVQYGDLYRSNQELKANPDPGDEK
jgi:hypothetical protein